MDDVGQEIRGRSRYQDGQDGWCREVGSQTSGDGAEGEKQGGVRGKGDAGEAGEAKKLRDVLLLTGKDVGFGEYVALFDGVDRRSETA